MNNINTIDIYALAFGGKGVGKVDGKICFVEGALPGERVSFIKKKEHSRYIEADLVEVLSSSGERIKPVCEYYGKCGGCQLQHLSYSGELFYKQSQVSELLYKIGGVEKEQSIEAIEPSSSEYVYRNTAEFHRKKNGYFGFYRKKSKDIVTIKACPVLKDEINDRLPLSGEYCKDRKVTLKTDYKGDIWSSCRPGERFFEDEYRGSIIFLSPKAFSQANRYIAEKISCTLDLWIGEESSSFSLFDAYCGSGFFSFLFKNDFIGIFGMDENRVAIDCAQTTKKKRNADNFKFYRGQVEKHFFRIYEKNRSKRNIVLLDPPRKGAGKEFLKALIDRKHIESIYYISCDPSSLARDIRILTEDDRFSLTRLKPFDMFPQTMHIETLAELKRE